MLSQDREVWVPIQGISQYLVGDQGNVRPAKRNRLLTPTINQQGHLKVNLMKDGDLITRSVTQLVARAFLPRPERRDFNSVIHLNGDKQNCRAANLAWRPRHFTVRYHQQFDSSLYANASSPVMDLDTREIYPDVRTAATTYGLLVSDIIVSSYARTFVWPTFQRFQLLED